MGTGPNGPRPPPDRTRTDPVPTRRVELSVAAASRGEIPDLIAAAVAGALAKGLASARRNEGAHDDESRPTPARSDHHWGWRRRHLPDVPVAGTGHRGDCAGSRGRPGRDLVLESLSGRPVRLGELHLRLLLLQRTARGVGVERALRRPAGDAALPQSRRGQVRSAPPHAVRLQGRGRVVRRRRLLLDRAPGGRPRDHEPVPA